MVFRFLGRERLFWPFETPNELGVALAGLALLAIAISVASSGRRRLIATVGVVIVCALLGLTYSRSGMVALGAGLLVIALLSSTAGRRRLIGCAAFSAAIFLFIPNMVERISVAQWQQDASVTNRVAVWSDASRLLADHPGGVGQFGYFTLFNAFYKRDYLKPTYVSAVNTYLTIACFRGILPISIVLLVVFGSFTAAFIEASTARSMPLVAIASIQAAVATGALFNNFLTSRLVLFLWFALLLSPMYFLRFRNLTRAKYFKIGACAGGLALALTSGSLIFGGIRNRLDGMPIVHLERASHPLVIRLAPRAVRVTARIVVAVSASSRSELNSAPVLKRLAAQGAEVVACVGDDRSPNFSSALNELIAGKSERASVFVGFGSAARLAPMVAAQIPLHASAALLVDKPLALAELDRPPNIPSLIVAVGHRLPLALDGTAKAGLAHSDLATRSTTLIEETDLATVTSKAMDAYEKWLAELLPAMGTG